jgi:hypothetical protein
MSQTEKELQSQSNISSNASPSKIFKKESRNIIESNLITWIIEESKEKLKLANQSTFLIPSRQVWLTYALTNSTLKALIYDAPRFRGVQKNGLLELV